MSASADRFNCPICFQVPEKEVYQCHNGHILCDKCCENLEQCPQCRVSIVGNLRGRNRALEEVLDDLKIDCPFSDNGCGENIKRKDVAGHKSSCVYGKELSLCKFLRFHTCEFKVNMGNLHQVVQPFKTNHSRRCFGNNRDFAYYHYQNFFEWPNNSLEAVLIQLKQPFNQILFLITLKDDSVSILLFDLNENNKNNKSPPVLEVSGVQTPAISWKLPVYPIMDFEKHFKNPIVKTYFPSLKKLRTDPTNNCCTFNIKIVK